MYDQSSDLRELSSTEIDVVAGGFPDAQLFGPGSNITFGAGPVTRENGNDRQANANLINARLQAAYAANPDVPRSQVYADFFNL